ncbi:peptide deformylase [Candidatus Jorgensenbacteria bacterium CG10_big_fil_rev_8_21_14_0_10_54_38]|uniref:Peptide deformylase n=2 Tax=Candidatus Joergenseniibacteriota TaxID=1752739 RepID=A0A2M6WGL7_9BACT|nr:MAG: peptide deformylase [Candidatus Jorgensenbacteria bacterium CG23_combo_of_CG06-09_8_20_14_all_54_14]PIT91931.1 MAG: peptide deformylase [Candidatus Jorgensenbacteria bacterium CG10_big_fil_rev_8_21_14_0_10_54_38]
MYLLGNKNEEKVLRRKLPPVDLARENTKELKELVKQMRTEMRKANGIGLSANQVGVEKRLFVAQVPDDQGRVKFYAVVNPEIVKTSKDTAVLEEGCLSVPERYGFVERPLRVTLQGFDVNGKKLKIKAWGLLARVFQHEVDHLNGTLFVDHVSPVINKTPSLRR